MTPLDKTLKRSLCVKGIDYVVTLTPEVLKLTRKGRRVGLELKWADITSGESALAVALHASVGRFEPGKNGKHAKTENLPKDTSGVGKSVSSRTRRSTPGLPTNRAR